MAGVTGVCWLGAAGPGRQWAEEPPLWRDPRLWLTPPGVVASAFIITGFFFHQTRLAEIRSIAASGSVIASGVAPTLMGRLIDTGVSLTAQAVGCLAYRLVAILLVGHVRRYARTV